MHEHSHWGRALRTLSFCALGAVTALSACVVEREPEAECGDDDLNGDDECDGSEFGGATCATEGFEDGQLSCTKSCTIDTSACVILDEDDDQLNIYDEGYWGTDPLNPDTDGDGVLDGEEIINGSDALNPASWPGWAGIWPNNLQDSIDAGVTGTGQSIGEVIPDVVWTDQNGKQVNLHQFYGYVVVLSLGARWCPPCNEAASTSQALLQSHMPQGVIFVEQLIDGLTPGVLATPEDATAWASQYGLQYPIVYNDNPLTAEGIPSYYVLDRELRIHSQFDGFPGDQNLSFAINNAVNASDGM
jgi:hypothetical protein